MSGAKREVYRLLDTNGDGTGTKNAIGDYSSTETKFFFQDTAKVVHINRLLIQVEDSGAFTTAGYGAIAGGTITNGILIGIFNDADELLNDLTDGVPIKSNNDWARVAYDLKLENWSSGNGAIHGRWTFANAGHPIVLSQGNYLACVLNDNFTGLVTQYFKVQGWSGKGIT